MTSVCSGETTIPRRWTTKKHILRYFVRVLIVLRHYNNNNFIYIAPLKTMFTKCSTESQGKTNGIVRNRYNI